MCLAANPPPFVQWGLGEPCTKQLFLCLGKRGRAWGGSVNEIFFQPFLNSVFLILKNF